MSQNESSTPAETGAEAKTAAAPKEIIRGRMPVAVVALARFNPIVKDLATKAAADKLGTTVGKVDDIRKNRNFSYVTEAFKPTEQQKADGIAWLERHPTGAEDLIQALKDTPVATAEEAAAFEQTRAANRGQSEKTQTGEVADAGGGNRRGSGKSKGQDKPADTQADPKGTGEALLA
jgi:hypothetical protein